MWISHTESALRAAAGSGGSIGIKGELTEGWCCEEESRAHHVIGRAEAPHGGAEGTRCAVVGAAERASRGSTSTSTSSSSSSTLLVWTSHGRPPPPQRLGMPPRGHCEGDDSRAPVNPKTGPVQEPARRVLSLLCLVVSCAGSLRSLYYHAPVHETASERTGPHTTVLLLLRAVLLRHKAEKSR